jgi:hypothetical protein
MSAADKAVIEWELIRLCVDFAHYLDTSAYEALANLFLPEGVWDRMRRLNGRQEILEVLRLRPANVVTRHVQTNFRFIHIDSETVNGFSFMVPYHGSAKAGALPGLMDGTSEPVIDLHDVYKRTSEGWRFAERITKLALVSADSPLLKRQPTAEISPLKVGG